PRVLRSRAGRRGGHDHSVRPGAPAGARGVSHGSHRPEERPGWDAAGNGGRPDGGVRVGLALKSKMGEGSGERFVPWRRRFPFGGTSPLPSPLSHFALEEPAPSQFSQLVI